VVHDTGCLRADRSGRPPHHARVDDRIYDSNQSDLPGNIAAGPNSTLWFADSGANAIGSFQSLVTNTHDFNGDGKSDIAWRDSQGNIAMWIMDGATIKSTTWMGSELTAWSIVGQRDFNGDGKADWMWFNTNLSTSMWLLDGPNVKTSAWISSFVAPPSYVVVGTGDFDGDGTGDLLWRDANGDTAIWFMNGTEIMGIA
jgi:hypothetical protein